MERLTVETPEWTHELPLHAQNAIVGALKHYSEADVRKAWVVGGALWLSLYDRASDGTRLRRTICREADRIQRAQMAQEAETQPCETRSMGCSEPSAEPVKVIPLRSSITRRVSGTSTLPRPPHTRPPRKPGPATRARERRGDSSTHPRIGQLSNASGYHLTPAAFEVLQLHRGIVICKSGWGTRDSKAERREYVTMTPAMSRHGRKLSWGRYKAARAELVRDGLLEVVGRERNQAPRTRPTWHLVDDPMTVWTEAARRQLERESTAQMDVFTAASANGPANAQRTPSERCSERCESRQVITLHSVIPGRNRTGSPDFLTPKTGAADAPASLAAAPQEIRAKSAGPPRPLGGARPAQEQAQESLMGGSRFHAGGGHAC